MNAHAKTERYEELQQRLEAGDVLILDGAVGTQLKELGVPVGVAA